MTVLTPEVSEVLQKLVQVARGDAGLVEEALTRAPRVHGEAPTLGQILDYIVANRDKQKPEPPAEADSERSNEE